MPYRMRKTSQGYCVFNSDTNENKGCSETRGEGVKHMAALYAAEGSDKKEIETRLAEAIADFTKETGEVFLPDEIDEKSWGGESAYFYPYSARSYAEVDMQREAMHTAHEVAQLLDLFPTLARNLIDDPAITDKGTAIQTLAEELAGKITELNGEDDGEDEGEDDMMDGEDMKDLDLSKIDTSKPTPGFLKRISGIADRLTNYVKSFASEKTADVDVDNGGLMIFKDESGNYRWLARYSNHFIDQDDPPDIISTESHRRFVKMVDEGAYPYPVIEIWHNKEWEFGVADWLAYDDSGFALASGSVYPGCEGIAEALSKLKNVGVSHGMPVTSIVRDPSDPRVIKEHQTVEISPLPLWAAANQLTSFQVLKGVDAVEEDDMGLPKDKKKAALESWGVSPDLLAQLENINQKDAAAANEAGIESKEADNAAEEAPETPVAPAAESEKPATEEEETDETVPDIKSISEAFAEVMTPMVAMLKEMQEKQTALESQIAALQTAKTETEKADAAAREKDAMIAAMSPVAALMAQFQGVRAVGDPATEVKSGDALAKSGPKELDATEHVTGIQFLDAMLYSRQ